ncbi:MAG: hypothetical protein M3R18_09920, partial [Pseudomonadota bacterium]|nr:hypothetical protein [Pseudomonadota bacterium]
MWKAMLAGIASLAIAGSSLVYAQQRPANPDAAPQETARDNAPGRQMSTEDAQAFAEARIAGLKA